MQKIAFDTGWRCFATGHEDAAFAVTLPHDAMLLDTRSPTSPSGVNNGWYDAQDYTYEKTFTVEEVWPGQKAVLEFEGVYHAATVYLNGEKVAYHSYGYTGFFVDITAALKEGENTLRVTAVNSDQPNCRWYSGTGIYRPVWLYILPPQHIKLEGVRVTTRSISPPRVEVSVDTTAEGPVQVEILDGNEVLASAKGQSDGTFAHSFEVPGARLWCPENPKLYTCRVRFGEDEQTERFGIRTVEWNTRQGFALNGERVILHGACIHHDNGLLGACAYDFAEQRKVRVLKENGYNALRSAHNPCSKAMLRACDEQGVLMVDEYVDVWYIHKNKFDYADEMEANYKEDLASIVSRDYNHPSVIMYSTGNEVSESGQARGIDLCGRMTEYLHELDETRPVTCGINIFFNFLSSIGFGVYSDKKADKAVKQVEKKKAVGSEFFNNLAGLCGSEFMKFGATLYPCDIKTRDAFANLDMAGYNYGIKRYRKDLKKYPDRLILGSETFCSDAYTFWELAKKQPRIVGDFVWAGMDYLGELGVGAFEYEDYAPDFSHGVGWVSAGSGRIDLTGKPLAEMRYTQVAFEQRDIAMGVIPVYQYGKRHSPSAWKMTEAMESWAWRGCEGKKTKVEVYARAHHVTLSLNGEELATKNLPENDCKVVFDVVYKNGTLRAASYSETGTLIAETSLSTAGEETQLTLLPEQAAVNPETDLCYVRLQYTDAKGIVKPMERADIEVAVEGGTLLGLGSACPYYPGSYLSNVADTYYGEAMAVIKPAGGANVVVVAHSKHGSARAEIQVKQ